MNSARATTAWRPGTLRFWSCITARVNPGCCALGAAAASARSAPIIHFMFCMSFSLGGKTSFDLDAGLFDDRPPFLDLALVERGKASRRLQLARGDVEPEIGEARLHFRVGERMHHRGVQLGDGLLRRRRRGEEPEPARGIE